MSIKQIEKLYKKIVSFSDSIQEGCSIDTAVRADMFHMIMNDIERLQKKIKNSKPNSREYKALDREMRQLLMKEIQIIIDDYMIARQNGTQKLWEEMYGDIKQYMRNFYIYREACASKDTKQAVDNYGFYNQDEVLYNKL